jgi:hypothetical protein
VLLELFTVRRYVAKCPDRLNTTQAQLRWKGIAQAGSKRCNMVGALLRLSCVKSVLYATESSALLGNLSTYLPIQEGAGRATNGNVHDKQKNLYFASTPTHLLQHLLAVVAAPQQAHKLRDRVLVNHVLQAGSK